MATFVNFVFKINALVNYDFSSFFFLSAPVSPSPVGSSPLHVSVPLSKTNKQQVLKAFPSHQRLVHAEMKTIFIVSFSLFKSFP